VTLRLRPWTPADAPALARAWADPETERWTAVPADRDEAAARRWIEGGVARRASGRSLDLVVDLDGEVVGEVGLAGDEVGWWIAPGHRRQGLGTRAVRQFARWVLQMTTLEAVVARCHPDNPGSSGVAAAAGFVEQPPGADGTRVWRYSAPG